MDIPSEQPVTPVLTTDRPGIALVSAITGLVLVGTIVAAMWTVVEFDRTSSGNRTDAARAQFLAEAGIAHVRSVVSIELKDVLLSQLLVGSDGVEGTGDDGLLIGYTLTSDQEIPTAGIEMEGGRYFVELIPAPGPWGSTQRILARSTGLTDTEASATIDVVLISTALPGLVTGGDLTINGNPSLLGECGGVHAQGDIKLVGNPTIEQYVEAEGAVTGGGTATDPDGNVITPTGNAEHVPIPAMDIAGHCAGADYLLAADGKVYDATGTAIAVASSSEWEGWKKSGSNPVNWDLSSSSPLAATYCAEGDVKITGNPAGALSIIATGDITVSGTPEVHAAHPKGLLFIAGGDVNVSGNASGSTINYGGLIYAGGTCIVRGNPSVQGQVVCANAAEVDDLDDSGLAGNADIQFECGGFFDAEKTMKAWYSVFGQ